MRFLARVLIVLSAGLATAFHPAIGWGQSVPLTIETFHRNTLLERFDGNEDGKLNAAERRQLRAAFGNVDIPMLPSRPHRYTQYELPVGFATALQQSDNAPDGQPVTDAGARLGRVLFYDRQLSKNDTIACASCHHQQHGFTDPRRFSVGFEAGETRRNAMSLLNLRFSNLHGGRPGFFWDERAATLEDQVLMPIQDPVEMGMTLQDLVRKLERLPYYPPLFRSVFGSAEVSPERIANALAQLLRAMVSFETKFDGAAKSTAGDYGEPFEGFTAEENLGKSLFIRGVDGIGELGCAHCHVPPTFGMPKSFNNGLDLRYSDRGLGLRNLPSNDPFTPTNDGKFKAPSLRNIALTAPYMHDGRFLTLEEVIEHYSSGVHSHDNLGLAFSQQTHAEQQTSGFHFSDAQKSALVAFLKTLTDQKFISDPKFSDPFIRRED